MRKPNIILLLLDSVRAKDCGIYGYELPTTPGLEYLGERGVVYEQNISPAMWTMPSVASLMTGTYPDTHRFEQLGKPFPERLMTLAEALRETGYATLGLATDIPFFEFAGVGRGFQEMHSSDMLPSLAHRVLRGVRTYIGMRRSRQAPRNAQRSDPAAVGIDRAIVRKMLPTSRTGDWMRWVGSLWYDKGASKLLDRALESARRLDRDQPFFMYLHIGESHGPYRPPARYRRKYRPKDLKHINGWTINQEPVSYYAGDRPVSEDEFRFLRAMYDGEIEYQDRLLMDFYRRLEAAGLAENTMFAVFADHGDNIGEKGLVRHSFCLYDTLVHVPLVVVYPGGEARRESRVVQTLDLPRTVADLAGVRGRFRDQCEGNSLLEPGVGKRSADTAVSELLVPMGKQLAAYRERLARYDCGLLSLRTSSHKYIYHTTGEEEFYALATDPDETRNAIAEPAQSEAVGRLRGLASPWMGRFRAAYDSLRAEIDGEPEPEIDADVEQRLRDLGYIE
jgi:arylsulfatase A-like enzyme